MIQIADWISFFATILPFVLFLIGWWICCCCCFHTLSTRRSLLFMLAYYQRKKKGTFSLSLQHSPSLCECVYVTGQKQQLQPPTIVPLNCAPEDGNECSSSSLSLYTQTQLEWRTLFSIYSVNDYNQLLILLLLLLTTATSTAAASDGAVIFCDIFLINQSHYCALVGVSIIVPPQAQC